MKSIILVLATLVGGMFNLTQAQDYSKLDKIVLKDKSDYAKHEKLILECSDFLLSSSIDKFENEGPQRQAMRFIIRWMEGTPDFTFGLDETISKVSKSNSNLLGLYMASMCKFALENKEKAVDEKEMKFQSYLFLIKYCENPAMNVKHNKPIKELIKANKDNNLKEYLKL